MEEHQISNLLLASRILSYPTNETLQELKEMVHDTNDEHWKKRMEEIVSPLFQHSLKDLQETYVATFDLKVKLGLYLTAHEFGDSPKRGAAIIKMQKMVNEAGFERVEGELADYIPMLYEFLAVVEDSTPYERLIKRLSCVTELILTELPEQSPFYPIVAALMEYVFEKPTAEELQEIERNREEADLEELPYPIMYT